MYLVGMGSNLAGGPASKAPSSFVKALKKATGSSTINLPSGAGGWDNLNLVFWAAKKANSVDSVQVTKALQKIGKATLPAGTLLTLPNPKYTATDHSMNNANFTSYYALLRPGAPDSEGLYQGTLLDVHYSAADQAASQSPTTTTAPPKAGGAAF
jgi:hypothetical protein